MTDNLVLGAIVFVAALLQVTIVASLDVAGGAADVLLLALLSIALLRGAITGAVAGFFGGLLVDIVTLDTLGVTALLYALAGYWTGRYGETTGRDRAHAPLLAVLVFTVAIAFAGFGLHFLLGEEVSARRALFETLLPSVVLNLILGGAVFSLCRSLLAPGDPRRAGRPRCGSLASSFPQRRSPSRRFLPPDPRTSEPYRFTPQLALRLGVLAALALAVFAVLFLRLWALQVLSGDRYLNAAQSNQLRTVPVEAPRGSIVDRTGRTIVSNVPGTAVQIWTADLPEEGRYAMFKKLSAILRVPLPKLTKALEESRHDPLTPILVKTAVHEDQVMVLKEHRDEFPGVEIVEHLPARLRVPHARRPGARLRRRDLTR